jgi:hypothetical protein
MDNNEYPQYPEKKKKRSPEANRLRWMLLGLVLMTVAPLLLAMAFWLGTQVVYHPEAALVGVWKGTLYQQPGGLEETYPFEMVIKSPDDGHVSVTTTIWLETGSPYYATMGGFGVGADAGIHFYEVNIVRENAPPDGRWCIKQGRLMLEEGVLSGSWTGEAGDNDCAPGRIELTRANSE